MRVKIKNNTIWMLSVSPITLLLAYIGLMLENVSMIIFSIILCIITFYIYLHSYNYKILSNISFLFPLIGGIYLLPYPTLKFILNLLPTRLNGISDVFILKGTFFGGAMIILYTIIYTFMPKERLEEDKECSMYETITLSTNNLFIDILFFAMLAYMVSRYISIGGYRAVFSGAVSRSMMSKELEIIPFYSYIKYAYISYTVYALFSVLNSETGTTKKYIKALRALIVCLFWVIDLSLGNRRGLLYVFLAIVLYFSNNKKRKIKTGFYVMGIVIIGFFMMVGVLRNALNTNVELKIRDAFGETIYPMVTLYYYMGNQIRPFYYGETFLYIIYFFIPRSVWPNKPISLANQFKIDYFNTSMGYAFTPFTEMYVNYSFFGIITGAVIYLLLFNWLSTHKNKYPLFYLATYMEVINFFRGEITSSIIEILVMYLTLKALFIVNKNYIELCEICL